MSDDTGAVLIYATYPSSEVAQAAARILVEDQLVACVNILPVMHSVYVWEGKVCEDKEVVGLFMTRASLADQVVHAVEKNHPYDTPAILILPVAGGGAGFLDWLKAQTRADGREAKSK